MAGRAWGWVHKVCHRVKSSTLVTQRVPPACARGGSPAERSCFRRQHALRRIALDERICIEVRGDNVRPGAMYLRVIMVAFVPGKPLQTQGFLVFFGELLCRYCRRQNNHKNNHNGVRGPDDELGGPARNDHNEVGGALGEHT
jgi:hypothetical protein